MLGILFFFILLHLQLHELICHWPVTWVASHFLLLVLFVFCVAFERGNLCILTSWFAYVTSVTGESECKMFCNLSLSLSQESVMGYLVSVIASQNSQICLVYIFYSWRPLYFKSELFL